MTKRSRLVFTLKGLLTGLLPLGTAVAQTTPPPTPDNTYLPPLKITRTGPLELRYRLDGTLQRAESGNVRLTWGDVILESDRLLYDPQFTRAEASGNVLLRRGDEYLKAVSLSFDQNRADAGFYVADDAILISPPFFISGKRLSQTTKGVVAEEARIAAGKDGKGEFTIRAKKIELRNDRTLILRNTAFYLYGTRLVSVPYVKRKLKEPGDNNEGGGGFPITGRISRISGFTLGVRIPVSFGDDYDASARIDFPTKSSIQYAFTAYKEFTPPPPPGFNSTIRPGSLYDPTPRPGESPIRHFLTARPPLTPDPLRDYRDLLPNGGNLSLRLNETAAPLFAARVNLLGNQEFVERRGGLLLLSRLPEATVNGRLPLHGTRLPENDAEARERLREIRPVFTGNLTLGNYREQQINQNERKTERFRTVGSIGFGTLPLLLGDNILIRPQVSYTLQDYASQQSYGILETSLAANLIFSDRASFGGAYIARRINGTTPFSFDIVDTRNEAQLRSQFPLGGRVTLAGVLRYDVSQAQFFDYQIAIGVRGQTIEPRFSYRRLGGQFGIGLNLIGFDY